MKNRPRIFQTGSKKINIEDKQIVTQPTVVTMPCLCQSGIQMAVVDCVEWIYEIGNDQISCI